MTALFRVLRRDALSPVPAGHWQTDLFAAGDAFVLVRLGDSGSHAGRLMLAAGDPPSQGRLILAVACAEAEARATSALLSYEPHALRLVAATGACAPTRRCGRHP